MKLAPVRRRRIIQGVGPIDSKDIVKAQARRAFAAAMHRARPSSDLGPPLTAFPRFEHRVLHDNAKMFADEFRFGV